MRYYRYLFPIFFMLLTTPCMSQEEAAGTTDYRIEAAGSVSTGANTPFWIVSNRYGLLPLEADNGYLRTGVFHESNIGENFRWSAGIDVVASTPRYRNVYLHQLYAEIGYKGFRVAAGSRENYISLWDRDLSSGDMVQSSNARPIPEISFSIPQFILIPFTKGLLQFRGDFAVGRSFEDEYISRFKSNEQYYIKNGLWHRKSLFIRFLDANNGFPLSAVVGIRHNAQWGGISNDPYLGEQPHSFNDLIRIILGKSGGTNASLPDQVNVLGNHYGSYDVKFGYLNPDFNVYVYKQHFFDDASGMELYNYPDGLYGIQANIPGFPALNKAVFEFINTRQQSGPAHYIWYDHSIYPGFGGGSDNYYNSEAYTTGVSYFNRSIGSPLITSPEYNKNGKIGFANNRIRAFHLGISGYLSSRLAYRILATSVEAWGTMGCPFLKKETSRSYAARISYRHPNFEDWLFAAELATDRGSLYSDNLGIGLTVTKTGLLGAGK